MREIGTVKRVQIQRSRLKLGEKPYRVFDPSPLLVVAALLLSSDGVIGVTEDGGKLIDVHNAGHPETRNHDGINGVSVSFTSHYREMRACFGSHLVDGCAGENILIETDRHMSLEDLGKRLAFQNPSGGELVYLDALMVAAPCKEFSHFVNQANLKTAPLSAEQLKSTLQFLDNGQRGFYAASLGSGNIQAGDKVFAVE
jgi:MOSC domain-containing protein YiiM